MSGQKAYEWELLAVAREIGSASGLTPRTTAQQCAAISRGYYAAYYAACKFLRERDGSQPRHEGAGSHDAVINALEQDPQPMVRNSAHVLRKLKRERVAADYAAKYERGSQEILLRCTSIIGILSRGASQTVPSK